MKRTARLFAVAGLLAGAALSPSHAQEATQLSDLDAAGRTTLSKAELQQLLPGATIIRTSNSGNRHVWKNDSDGTFVASTDNKSRANNKSTTVRGKWSISDDGRYCITIEWRAAETEDWCRLIVKAGGNYYGVKSDQVGAERVHRLEISK